MTKKQLIQRVEELEDMIACLEIAMKDMVCEHIKHNSMLRNELRRLQRPLLEQYVEKFVYNWRLFVFWVKWKSYLLRNKFKKQQLPLPITEN